MASGAKKRRDADAMARQRHGQARRADRAGQTEPEAMRFEALGRVMAALATEADFMETSRDLTWWQGTEQDWNIEWREGPYASEVAALLAARVPGPVGAAGRTDRSSAAVTVMGVPFTLRAIDPLGRERLGGRAGLWRLAAALNTSYPDPPRRSLAHRHWEELLGG